jgi:TonB-linked SusC/RagA family outer membrane protein
MMKTKSKKLKLNAFLWALLIPVITFAQQSISGTITDVDTGEPLLGVTVLVQGTNKGTVSDFDGNYLINGLDAGDYVLEVSYTGYSKISQAVTVGSSDVTQDLQMSFSASELNEIVVTGTGAPVAKKQLGNSIGSITTASLEKLPINSFSDLLAGREPGIVAFPSGGLTGEGAQIRIRGNASLSQLNEPIVIVDGIRVDRGGGFGGGFVGSGGGGSTSRLDDINPESIERVEILKGASAATLFGTEASNGVIQIFTKKGQNGAPRFGFKATQGFISYPIGAVPDNTGWTSSASTAADLSQFYGYTIRPYQLISTNAMEDLYETGVQNTVNANVSGGNEKITYFTSARYSYTDGPFGAQQRDGYLEGQETNATDLDRLAQFNINLNINPNDKWSIRLTQGFTSRFSTTAENNNNIYGVGSLAQFSKPELAGENNTTGTIAFATVDETLQVSIDSKVSNYNGSMGVNFYPTDWLKIDATFGLNYSSQSSTNFWPFAWNIDGFSGSRPLGQLSADTRNFLAQTGEVKASFNNNIGGNITSNLIIGGQYISEETKILGAQGTEFPGPGFEVTSAAGVQSVFEFFTENITAGIFAQEQIGFSDQLFVTLGARLDANSAFGSEFNAAFYPKVSASYIPSDSANWNDIGPISSLQLRGSYGQSGLQPLAFSALTSYQALASATGAGIAPNNLGNPELSPEISKEWEVGFTAGLIDDKVNLEFTYFDRVTEDALYARQFPLSGGFRNTQLTNIGELAAYGMEINLSGTVIRTQDLTLNLYVNGAYYRDQVVSLGGAPPLKVGGSYPRYRNFLIEGEAPGANFGAQLLDVGANELPVDIANSDGLPDTRDQLISYFTGQTPDTVGSVPTSIGTGSVLLKDEDGDGDYLDHYLGKSTPDWTGSFGGSLSYKNFTLSTTFEYKAGNFVINNLTDAFRQANGAIGRNLPTSSRVVRDYATGGVDGSFNPLNDPSVRVDALDEWLNDTLALAPFSGLNTLEKADYISWNELSLNYQFTGSILDSFGLETASLGLSGRNIAIFTGYSGVDPRINFVGRGSGSNLDQNFGQGIAAFGWPVPRQAIITLKVGF